MQTMNLDIDSKIHSLKGIIMMWYRKLTLGSYKLDDIKKSKSRYSIYLSQYLCNYDKPKLLFGSNQNESSSYSKVEDLASIPSEISKFGIG